MSIVKKYRLTLEEFAVKNFVAGKWIDKAKKIEVTNPFDNSVIDAVPKADAGDLERRWFLPSAAPR